MAALTPFVVVTGATKTFGGTVRAVDALSLDVDRGEIVAVLGPSGCGKTTLLRLIAGFERLDAGEIRVGGRMVDDSRLALPPEQREIGFVFQDYALFPHLTVAANVAFGIGRLARPLRAERVARMLALCGVAELAARYPHELSGGQQQRAALARALAPGHGLVLLDEPLSNVDAETRRALRQRVRAVLREAGATAILVTHDREDAFAVGDRIAVLRGGQLEQTGPPSELYLRPATAFVAGLVGDISVLPIQTSDGAARTPLGPLTGTGAAAAGQVAVFRPDDLEIREAGACAATVVEATFGDGRWIVALRLVDGEIVRASSATRPETGARVHVHAARGWICGA